MLDHMPPPVGWLAVSVLNPIPRVPAWGADVAEVAQA